MTTVSLSYHLIQRKIKSISLPSINWKSVDIIGISACLLLLVFYVFYVNQLTQGTYLIKNYNKKISVLSRENKSIETEFSEAMFLGQIDGKVNALGFEKTKEVKYLEILDAELAKK